MTDRDLARADGRNAAAPRLWVLGHFAMTGGRSSLHASGIVAAAEAAGLPTLTLCFHKGAFAEASITAVARSALSERPDGVVYLRCLARLSGNGLRRGVPAWIARLRALRRLIGASGQVALIGGPSRPTALHRLGFALLRLALTPRPGSGARLVRLPGEMPPAELVGRLAGVHARDLPPEEAEARVFRLIRDRSGADLRLTDQHVDRALNGPAGAALPRPVREDLLSLARQARQISEREVEAALCRGQLSPAADASRALRAAFATDAGSGWPAIAAHLRALGKHPRHWRRYLPRSAPPPPTGEGYGAALLRDISGAARAADRPVLAALDRPVLGPGGGRLTRREWFLTLAMRLPVDKPETLAAPWAAPALRDRLRAALPDRHAARAGDGPALRLAGVAGNGTGLAMNFWMSAKALDLAGFSPLLCPSDVAPGVVSTLPAPPPTPAPAQMRRNVTLLHANADRIPLEILALDRRADAFHIGYLLWELDRVPAVHRLGLDMLDEIWAPSRFVQGLYAREFAREVVLMKKAITLPAPGPWPRPPIGVTRFLVCFDQRSSVARKNPLAAVRAFSAAFGPGRHDVELVVKATAAPASGKVDPEGQMRAIRAAAGADTRISVIERDLPFASLLGMIAGAGCVLSPHRAEGFGYIPAFALCLGVPVIATDYSGTTDFCTPGTSDPVPARLVAVPHGQAIHPTPGARWAEVDPDALADALHRVADDPAAARARAAAGQALMRRDYGAEGLAARYRARLDALGLLAPSAPAPTADMSAGRKRTGAS